MHLMEARGTRLLLTLSLLALSAVSSPAWAGVPASPPPSWIYDGANLLTPDELAELSAQKAQLEQQTGARLVVLTLAEAHGETPKSLAVRTLNEWNAGRNSALLLVLLSPRELYIQPGTDLAPVLDSATSSSICSGVIAPKLRSGNRAAAIRAGLEAIATRIRSGGASSEPSAQSSARTLSPPSEVPQQALRVFPNSGGSNEGIRSRWADFTGPAAWLAGVVGLVMGALGLSRLLSRKCQECGTRMKKKSRVTLSPTYSSSGEGVHTFSCGGCGYSVAETYFISQLVESSTSSSDSSYSSSDSSWSSSSSDSSSSSSSSSDSSGGGGSSW
jgi:uncharacterized protein